MIRVKSVGFSAVILAATACGSVATTPHDTSSTTSNGGGGHGGASGTTASSSSSATGDGGGSPFPTVMLSGKVVRSFSNNTPLAGVTVCVYAEPAMPCVQTDAQGAFAVPVPIYTETGITLVESGSGSVLLPFFADKDMTGWIVGLPSKTSVQTFYGAANVAYPDDMNAFLAVAVDQGTSETGVAGVAVSIAPAPGVGPLYAAAGGATPDPALQATSSAGRARFAQVTPGTVTIDVAPGVLSCGLRFGGWDNGPDSLRAPIVAGFETHVGFGCK